MKPVARGGTLFVTNTVTHYRKPLFSRLARELPARFVFFSDGKEWYWRRDTEPVDDLPASVLPGVWIGRTRISRGLVGAVARGPHDVVIKCLTGRYALLVTFLVARLTRRKFVLWASLWRHPRSLVHRIGQPVVRHIYRRSDAIVTYGRHVTAHVIEQGARRDRVFEAPQSIDMLRFQPRPVDRDEQLILFVGRLEPGKGPDVLLEALGLVRNRLPGLHARFVGDGPLAPALRRRATHLGLDPCVVFAGHIPNDELPIEYSRAGVAVVPSVETTAFAEPWSLAVNEAMACGSLVVTSDHVGAMRDGLVTDGVTGRTFPAGDAHALATVLRETVGSPTARKLADAGYRAVQDYNLDAAIAGFTRAVAAVRDDLRGDTSPASQSCCAD